MSFLWGTLRGETSQPESDEGLRTTNPEEIDIDDDDDDEEEETEGAYSFYIP